MRTAFATERLQLARTSVQQALDQWNPVDLDRVEASRCLLEESLSALRDVAEIVREGSVRVNPGFRDTVAIIKKDIVRATRLVDAGAAFHRGLASRLGPSDTSYDAAGKIASGEPVNKSQVLC